MTRGWPFMGFALAVLLGSCSFNFSLGNNLDMEKLKTALKKGVEEQVGIMVESVTCPEKREQKKDDEFECSVDGEKSSTFTIKVVQTDDKGNVNWEVTDSKGVVDLETIESQILENLKQQTGVDGTVDCGEKKYRAAQTNDTFDCEGTDQKGNKVTIAVELTDNEGHYRWKAEAK